MLKKFILIAILTPLCVFTQNTKETVTDEQQQKILEIFDAQYIIKSSKTISNYKAMDSVLRVREIQIKELNGKIEALEAEHKKTLLSIIKNNQSAISANKDIDSINSEQLKTAREERKFNWNLTHLYAGAESREFNFNQIEFNAEFMIELEKVHFGVKAFALPDINGTYKAGAGLKVRYKFF